LCDRFAEKYEQLQKALAVTEKQLDTFDDGSNTEIAVDEMDGQTLNDIEIQLLNNEPLLVALRHVAATLITHTPDSQLDNAEVQCMLERIDKRFTENRTVIANKRHWLDTVLRKKKDCPSTTNALQSWLFAATSELAEMCKAVSIDRFGCEHQLSMLISMSKEFDRWQEALEADSYRTIIDVSTVSKTDLVQKFAATRTACLARLDKQQELVCFIDDAHRTIEKIAVWSAAISKKFCVDKSNVARLVVADLRRACQELKLKRETVDLFRSRADRIIENLRLGVDGERCVVGRKSEKSLVEPLNELHFVLSGLFESLQEKLLLLVSM